MDFKEIAKESERDRKNLEKQEKYLKKNLRNILKKGRFEEKVCYCGKKHDGYRKTCDDCLNVDDYQEHGIDWLIP